MRTMDTTPEVQQTIAETLSKLTGDTWNVKPGNGDHGRHEFSLYCDEHYIMATSEWHNPMRLALRAIKPKRPSCLEYNDVSFKSESITVAKDRFAENIAKDINRRLLPKANEAWKQWHESVARVIERRKEASGTIMRLAQVVPFAKPTSKARSHGLSWYDQGGLSGSIEVREYSGSIQIDLDDVPADLAEQVLRAVARYRMTHSAI